MQKKKYSQEALEEFKKNILVKREKAMQELLFIKESIKNFGAKIQTENNNLENGPETIQKESLNQLALRQKKFIDQLDAALIRISNGTYGICTVTKQLIDKERLKAVPHTLYSIEGKNALK